MKLAVQFPKLVRAVMVPSRISTLPLAETKVPLTVSCPEKPVAFIDPVAVNESSSASRPEALPMSPPEAEIVTVLPEWETVQLFVLSAEQPCALKKAGL